jgi:hypothetical protein
MMGDSATLKERRMPALVELERVVAEDGLEKYLERLIAEREHVRPEQVTEEYIRNERARKIYPNVRYETDSGYGGYCTIGLQVLTRDEIDGAARRMDDARRAYEK